MIRVTVYRRSGIWRGFVCEGHAGYAKAGADIVCAAVSALVVNAANSVELLAKDACHSESREGYVRFFLSGAPSCAAALLLDSMVLGLAQVQEAYGRKYLTLTYEEE